MRTKHSNPASTSESRFLGNISTSSLRNLLPRSISSKPSKSIFSSRNPSSNAENTPPLDPNVQTNYADDDSASATKPLLSDLSKSQITEVAPSDGQKQPSATIDPPVKSETDPSDGHGGVLPPPDPSVKVVVRIRPTKAGENWGDRTVKKVSSRKISVGDRTFSFDSVFDSKSGQEDVFQKVGVPLVKNALAGYNTSILSYGQSGSGKTYTLWGPPSAMVEDSCPGSCQGIVPRIFEMLFLEIQKEQENSEGKQLNYQFRCSFLEIYNEQIGDLLDPTLRNLEIKDDPKNGVYVENLTEEYVTSYEDVTQILIKGLSSRKVGATSMNSKSSRSHIVCTFIIESWCKETSSKCFGSSKTSRMSFIDLAGLNRNRVDDTGRKCAREDKYVKKSLSRLGLLVNTLAKAPQSGKSEDVPYKASCLTHLLQESIGGNSKLTVICAVSPDNKNDGEILRTLRFGERVKYIRNEPVINEITEDDVNGLTDQIRQLKEELIRAKSSGSVRSNNGYFQGRNVRESLNQLRVSLNRSLILPHIDNDSDEELNVDEDDVRELRQQLLHSSTEENIRDYSVSRDSVQFGGSCDTDLTSEDDFHSSDEKEIEEIDLKQSHDELPLLPSTDNFELADNSSLTTSKAINPEIKSGVSISLCCRSPFLQDPTLSESPKLRNAQRKSVTFSPSCSVSQNNVPDNSKLKSDVLRKSLNQSEHTQSSLRSSKIFPGPTESLAASLQRGLQIIDHHQQNSAPSKSSVSFSFEHLTLKPRAEVDKANSSPQTIPETRPSIDGPSDSLLCASCKRRAFKDDTNDAQDSLKTWTVAVNEAGTSNLMTEGAMEKAAKREELEIRCMEQAAKIEQLNQLVEQYKSGKSDSSAENGKEMIPYDEFKDGKKVGRNGLLSCSSVDILQPEIIKEKFEIKEIQNELDLGYGGEDFDLNEKEALLKEVQMLRRKLQSRTDASPNKSIEKLRSSLLSRSMELRKSGAYGENTEEELERERQRWTEMESDWISLTDDLRVDLEANRRRAEKVEMELRMEKQCTEELDDALHRSVLGHARMVEHYAELQDKYNDLVGKHRAIMEGIAEVKRAAVKAGAKGRGSRFAKSLAAELSVLRVERERERELLKKENKSLKIQLRDTAEAVHAAGELLVRLREAENAASVAEENFTSVHQENDKLKKQIEKLKRKHKMEMITTKQYLAESKLPESALKPLYRDNSANSQNTVLDDDQAWRTEFGAIYQEHY